MPGFGAVVLLAAGCGGSDGGGSSLSITDTKACFRESGYTTTDRPDLGFADVSADDWYDVKDSNDDDVVTVAYFKDSGDVDDANAMLVGIAKSAAKSFGIEVNEDEIDDVVRTSGNFVYWWNSEEPTHEQDVERCVNP